MGTAAGGAIVLLLAAFAGRTGLRAVLSFALTVLMLWKVLVPLYLKGWNPIWVGLAVTLALTVLNIALVYGFDRRCAAAVSGSFGLVTVAPFTALCAGMLLAGGSKSSENSRFYHTAVRWLVHYLTSRRTLHRFYMTLITDFTLDC